MPKLTKKQIADMAKLMDVDMFKTIELTCDDYRISLKQEIVNRQIRTWVYVDGLIKGKWTKGDCPESKYWRKTKHTMYQPDFASPRMALNHINKVSENVQILKG